MKERLKFLKPTKKMKLLLLLIELEKNQNISQQKLANKISVTVGQVNNYIRELSDKNYIYKEGTGRTMSYIVTKEGRKVKWKLLDEFAEEKNRIYSFINRFQNNDIVNIAIIDSLGTCLPLIAKEIGLLTKKNINIDKYVSGKEMLNNFKEKYHYALIGSAPAFLKMSAGCPMEIIAEISTGGHILLAKEGINNIDDLKNVDIYIPTRGSQTENILNNVLNNNFLKGISLNEDRNLIDEVKNNSIDDNIQCLLLWEPYASLLLHKHKEYKIIYNFNQNETNNYISRVLIKNKTMNFNDFDFEKIIKDTVKFTNNNKKETSKIISKIFNIEEKIIKKIDYKFLFKKI